MSEVNAELKKLIIEVKKPHFCKHCNLEITQFKTRRMLYHPGCKKQVLRERSRNNYKVTLADPEKSKRYKERIGKYREVYNKSPQAIQLKKARMHNYYLTHKEKWVRK